MTSAVLGVEALGLEWAGRVEPATTRRGLESARNVTSVTNKLWAVPLADPRHSMLASCRRERAIPSARIAEQSFLERR